MTVLNCIKCAVVIAMTGCTVIQRAQPSATIGDSRANVVADLKDVEQIVYEDRKIVIAKHPHDEIDHRCYAFKDGKLIDVWRTSYLYEVGWSRSELLRRLPETKRIVESTDARMLIEGGDYFFGPDREDIVLFDDDCIVQYKSRGPTGGLIASVPILSH